MDAMWEQLEDEARRAATARVLAGPASAGLEAAATALARLESALRISPVGAGFVQRGQLAGAVAAARDQGLETDARELWLALVDLRAPEYDPERRITWSLFWYRLCLRLARRGSRWTGSGAEPERVREEALAVRLLERRIRAAAPGTLASITNAACRPDRATPLPYYRLAFAALLRRRRILPACLPALFPRPHVRRSPAAFLEQLATNAAGDTAVLLRSERAWRDARVALTESGVRSTSAVWRLLDLLYADEAVRPAWAARRLEVSVAQVSRAMAQLAALGAATEVSGRERYTVWTAACFDEATAATKTRASNARGKYGPTYGAMAASDRRGSVPADEQSEMLERVDRSLEDTLRDVDQVLARTRLSLDRLTDASAERR